MATLRNLTSQNIVIDDIPGIQSGSAIVLNPNQDLRVYNDDLNKSAQAKILIDEHLIQVLNYLEPEGSPELATDSEVMVAQIAALQGLTVDASTTAKGVTKLSCAPALATNPIAIGTNDTRVGDTPFTAALKATYDTVTGKENTGVAATLDGNHLTAFDHTAIAHANRVALDGTQESFTTALKATYDTVTGKEAAGVAAGLVTGHENTYPHATPGTVVLCVDGSRTGSYTADGSPMRPYKTIQAAINAVAALNQIGTVYALKISTGLYAENLVAESAGIGHLVLEGAGIVNVDPASGNAFQSATANANLKTLYFANMTFRKPLVITGQNGDASFTDVVWTDCDFVTAATIAATCVNNLTIRGGYSECAVTYANVNWSWIEGSQLQGALSLTADSTLAVPSQGSACTVAMQSAFAAGAPTFAVGGTATLTVAVFGGRFGTGNVTIPAGCTVLGYGAILRDNWTNNGALHLRGSFVQGTLAGTLPVLTSHASQLQNDSNVVGTSVADALNTLNATPGTKVLYVDGNRAGSYTEDGSPMRPYKTIQAAEAAADAATVIVVNQAVYSGALTLTNAFAVWGQGWPTISGAVAVSGNHKDLRNLHFTGSVTLNTDVEMWECDCDAGLTDAVADPSKSSTIIHGTFTNASGSTPFTKTGTQVVMFTTGQIVSLGDAPAVNMSAGRLVLVSMGVMGTRAASPILVSSGGVVTMQGAQVLNFAGGPAADIQNGAAASNPNSLAGVFATGNVVCGAASTVVNGLNFLGVGAISGSATLNAYPGFGDYVNDAAAAVGGVPINGLYHTTGAVKVRLV